MNVNVRVREGPESKIMLNDKGPRFKRSKLDKMINVWAVLFCAVLLLFMCVSSAVGQWVWSSTMKASMNAYIPIEQSLIGNSTFITALVSALTFLIYYQVFTVDLNLNLSLLFTALYSLSVLYCTELCCTVQYMLASCSFSLLPSAMPYLTIIVIRSNQIIIINYSNCKMNR